MKPFLFLGILFLALSSCGRIDSVPKTETTTKTPSNFSNIETPKLTDEQREIITSGKELDWKVNGLSWKIPQDMNKLLERDMILTYRSPATVTFVASASPAESYEQADYMMQKNYDQAVRNKKNNIIGQLRYMEIGGVKGFEYIEIVPNSDGWRRHQWFAYREFNRQFQVINAFCGAKADDFDRNKDLCAAILYSMKVKS